MSPPKSLYGAARLETLRLKGELDTHKKAVNAIAFSPDNKLLASADDEGLLAIQETETNTCIRLYKAQSPVVKLVWNPIDPSLLFVGCANGEVVKLTVSKKGVGFDSMTVETVQGWIHAMAVSKNGDQVAVACGTHVKAVSQQSLKRGWTPAVLLPVPKIEDGFVHPLVREVHIVEGLIIVVFLFVEHGVIAYSASPPHSEEWKLQMREGVLIAGSAISPSGHRLAVANMVDGVTIYDLKARIIEETIIYNIGRYLYVDVAFVDEKTVLLGHPTGSIVAVDLGEDSSQRIYTVSVMKSTDPVQTLACAILNGRLRIVAGSTADSEPARLFMIEEDLDILYRKKSRTVKRKVGCCLIQTILGLTTMAIVFASVVAPGPLSLDTKVPPSGESHVPLPLDGTSIDSYPTKAQFSAEKIALTDISLKVEAPLQTTLTTTTRVNSDKPPTPIRVETPRPPALINTVVKPATHVATETVTRIEPVFITLTETQTITAEASVITVTEAHAATPTENQATTVLPKILTVIAPEAKAPLLWEGSKLLQDIFHLSVLALCALAVYMEGNAGDRNEDVHECAATAELERIREIATEEPGPPPANGRPGEHGAVNEDVDVDEAAREHGVNNETAGEPQSEGRQEPTEAPDFEVIDASDATMPPKETMPREGDTTSDNPSEEEGVEEGVGGGFKLVESDIEDAGDQVGGGNAEDTCLKEAEENDKEGKEDVEDVEDVEEKAGEDDKRKKEVVEDAQEKAAATEEEADTGEEETITVSGGTPSESKPNSAQRPKTTAGPSKGKSAPAVAPINRRSTRKPTSAAGGRPLFKR